MEVGDSDTEIASTHTTESKSEDATADDATTDEPMVTGHGLCDGLADFLVKISRTLRTMGLP